MKTPKGSDGLESFFKIREKRIKSQRRILMFLLIANSVFVTIISVCAFDVLNSFEPYFEKELYYGRDFFCDFLFDKPEIFLPLVKRGNDIDDDSVEQNGKVNLNTADATELDTVPGIGKVKAQRIIETRETLGGFRTVDDLLNVSGFGEKTVNMMRDYVFVK